MAFLLRRIRMPLPCTTSPFSCIHFSPFSSTPTPNPQTPLPPVSLFLLTECQFSASQISKIVQTRKALLKARSADTACEAVEFLKQQGFTQPQLHTTILRYPAVLASKVDSQLQPKFHFFRTLGFTDQDIRKLISIRPRVLCTKLESNIIPRISFLENLFGGKPNLIKALTGSKRFVYVIRAVLCNRTQTIEKKMKHLQCLGLLEDEVREILKKQTSLLTCSTKKIQENMDFLTKTAGLKPNAVFLSPTLLQFSVKKRLMPRHAVFKALSSEQQSVPSLLTIFKLSERRFLGKIVECSPQASMLKEIYKSEMESTESGSSSSSGVQS